MTEGKDFQQVLERAIDFLNKDSNLQIFEEFIKNHLISNSEHDTVKFMNFQIELTNFLGEHMNVLFQFLKANVIPQYTGRHKTIYKRILNLRHLSHLHFVFLDNSLTIPDRIKGNYVSFNESYPRDFLVTIINNNNKHFNSYMDFNGALNLVNSLISNLNKKFHQGSNDIDKQLIDEFNNEYDNLTKNLNAIISKS
ncbi:hypothetical protein ABES80_13165 [Bacillus gobiensis]|uniref:hypothetical protein n=1 Tax=Bacillus gobiensis TaxID=1441095 RepID=UPI003D213134